jgi:hypothetical protein
MIPMTMTMTMMRGQPLVETNIMTMTMIPLKKNRPVVHHHHLMKMILPLLHTLPLLDILHNRSLSYIEPQQLLLLWVAIRRITRRRNRLQKNKLHPQRQLLQQINLKGRTGRPIHQHRKNH